jgi:hypothetical protein
MLAMVYYYESQVYDESYWHPRRDRILYYRLGKMERLRYNEVSCMKALIYVELSLFLNIKNKRVNKYTKKYTKTNKTKKLYYKQITLNVIHLMSLTISIWGRMP